jgi:hypothetical protein
LIFKPARFIAIPPKSAYLTENVFAARGGIEIAE